MSRLFTFLLKPFLFISTPFLKSHAKRLIAISALYGCVSQKEVVSEETLRKLNEALHLVSKDGYENSILVPMRMSSLLWNEEEINLIREVAESKDPELVVNSLVRVIPESLRYENEREDVVKLVQLLPELSLGTK